MITKIEISTVLETVTGMHIGGTNEFAAIGAIDSPVVRDAISRLPMIPGSSIKGKMRSLLSREYSDSYLPVEVKNDPDIVKRLFGDSNTKEYRNARLGFCDSVMSNLDEIKRKGASRATEVKFENTIKRLTSEANPRQIERVIPGCRFKISIIYTINSEAQLKNNEIIDDFKALRDGITLLETDYIGGSGTRGYGRVKFENFSVRNVFGDIDSNILDECEKIICADRGND